MKTMTCTQLGGACSKEFRAETFDEMAQLSKKHGTEMFEKNDMDHIAAMEGMKNLMQKPEDMAEWMEEKQKEFNSLPEEK